MAEKITVPTLGESVTEATVSKWLKSVGEKVDSDEPLVELETDKVNVEVPSPSSGVLEKISVKKGYTLVCVDSRGINAFFIRKDLEPFSFTLDLVRILFSKLSILILFANISSKLNESYFNIFKI